MATVSTLEMLPDEMILHICQYLRGTDILYSFFNLNTRLNMTITRFCHYLNLNGVTHRQFDWILSKLVSQIGLNIRSFVINGNWTSFLSKNLHSIRFDSNLPLMFPNLQTLTLEYFNGQQLLSFIDKIKGLLQLVKLDIKYLMERRSDELLRKVLTANHGRLRSITFDQNSIFLGFTLIDKTISYPKIEELTVNLIDCHMIADLFTVLPNVRRLHINLGAAPGVSLTKLKDVSPLIHLNDFQLHSINMVWTVEDVLDILCKMPSLQKLALYLVTGDENLVNGQILTMILPASLVQLHFFFLYFTSKSSIEVDTLLNTWPPGRISISCFWNESQQCAIIHTVPFNLFSIAIPSIVAKHTLPAWKYMQKVTNLSIFGESSSIDILKTVQHFHQLRTLKIDLYSYSEESMYLLTRTILAKGSMQIIGVMFVH